MKKETFYKNARLHAIIGYSVTDNMQMTNTQHEKNDNLSNLEFLPNFLNKKTRLLNLRNFCDKIRGIKRRRRNVR